MRIDLLIMLGAFIAGTLIALLLGAANTGIALAFGQIAFAIAAIYVIGKRP
jgi:uncharacterized membrane protein (DUF485 family)